MTSSRAGSPDNQPAEQTTTAARPLSAHPPKISAERARKFGSWYYAEHALKVMNGYRWTLLAYSVGNPVMYLFAMGVGLANAYMPSTGGREDIGLLPGWAATYLLSMDKRAAEVTLGTGDLAGSWSIHYRDRQTDRPDCPAPSCRDS